VRANQEERKGLAGRCIVGGVLIVVEGKRSDRSSAMKFKGLLRRLGRSTRGLGNRFCDPPPANSDSLWPTSAKMCAKLERWLEQDGMSWVE